MLLTLALAGLAMGAAASPHCAAMCGAPCARVTRGCGRSAAGFHAGRLLGYMAAGAVAAGSVALLGAWSQAAPALRPFWILLHLALLAVGLWWLATGRQAAWAARSVASPLVRFNDAPGKPARSALIGLAWVSWPCAALQSALLLAALADGPEGGALVMACYALGSMPGLAFAPWAWAKWKAWGALSMAPDRLHAVSLRLAGFGLALTSGWALSHGLWARVAAWCVA